MDVEVNTLTCRITATIITFTDPGITVQLVDKNKMASNSIQTLIFVEYPIYAQVWHMAFFIVGTKHSTIANTHLVVPLKRVASGAKQ